MKNDFRDVICEILKIEGPGVLKDPVRFRAYITDLAIEYPKEKRFLMANCNEEYIACFRGIGSDPSSASKAETLAVQTLHENRMIDRNWSEYISGEIVNGICMYHGAAVLPRKNTSSAAQPVESFMKSSESARQPEQKENADSTRRNDKIGRAHV